MNALLASTTPTPSTGITGVSSRMALKNGWGSAAISGGIPANGESSSIGLGRHVGHGIAGRVHRVSPVDDREAPQSDTRVRS